MRNAKKVFVLLIILILFSSYSFAEEDTVYVVPIKGEINRAVGNYVSNTVEKLNKKNAKRIILEIDIYGGLIDEAINIKDATVDVDIATIFFVNYMVESDAEFITTTR